MENFGNLESEFSKISLGSNDTNNLTPVIFILGPTSIGKTKISLSLAKSLMGQIINSDAFSLYKKADILTAKASDAERCMIIHHMLDILELKRDKLYCHKLQRRFD